MFIGIIFRLNCNYILIMCKYASFTPITTLLYDDFLRIKCFFAHFLLKNSAFHSESSDYSEFSDYSDYSEFSDYSDHSDYSELLISSLYPLKKSPSHTQVFTKNVYLCNVKINCGQIWAACNHRKKC